MCDCFTPDHIGSMLFPFQWFSINHPEHDGNNVFDLTHKSGIHMCTNQVNIVSIPAEKYKRERGTYQLLVARPMQGVQDLTPHHQ